MRIVSVHDREEKARLFLRKSAFDQQCLQDGTVKHQKQKTVTNAVQTVERMIALHGDLLSLDKSLL